MKPIPESKQNLELDDTLARIVKELSSSVVGQFHHYQLLGSSSRLWITPSETGKMDPKVSSDLSLIRVHAGFLGLVPESLRKRASRSAV
jgi:hypothetical protein